MLSLQCCMLYNLWLCRWQSWLDCGIMLSVMLIISCPLLLMVCGAACDHHMSVITCVNMQTFPLCCCWCVVSMVELLHHFCLYWPWLMGCILITCGWDSFDTEINSSLNTSHTLSSRGHFWPFCILMITSPPSSPAYHQLLVCTAVTVSSRSLAAWLTVYLIADCGYSAFPKSSFLSFGFSLFFSFCLMTTEWTRPPLGWWLALSTTSWETGTMECPLAPSMSSRQYVCAFCGCNCLCVHVLSIVYRLDIRWLFMNLTVKES